jgi:hypothetical protein
MAPGDHLFRRESGRMVAALTRIFGGHNLAPAEDVVQDAFCRALEGCGASAACRKPVGLADGDRQAPCARRAPSPAQGQQLRPGTGPLDRERIGPSPRSSRAVYAEPAHLKASR